MPQDMQPDTEAASHGTPLKALRAHCVECCNGNFAEVRACSATACSLWPYRFGKRPTSADKAVGDRAVYPIERKQAGATGLKAIRRRCLDCSGNRDPDVRSCAVSDCALHPFRLGRNPFLAPRSVEWQQAAAERLASLKKPALPKSPRQNPLSAGAQVLEGEQSPG